MSRGRIGTKTLATLLIASFCLVSTSSSAEAGWGRHRHHGFHYGVRYSRPRYVNYGWHSNYSYARYRVAYPVYHRTYVPYYYPAYYPAPYVNYGCFGYGYRPWVGFGGYYSANSVSVDRVPTATAKILAPAVQPATQFATARPTTGANIELKLDVPEDARVTINDRATSAVGSDRAFVIRGGALDDLYPFVVRAEIERDGRTITETRRVSLRGGQASFLSFAFDGASPQIASFDEPVNTTVRLRVPEDAKVFLAGHEMKQKGEVRVFETNKLRVGEELKNYTVRVTMGDEKTENRVKQLTLVGGETQEVAFDFSSSKRLVSR